MYTLGETRGETMDGRKKKNEQRKKTKTMKASMKEVPSHIGLSEYSRNSTSSPLMIDARSRAGIHKSRSG